MRNKKKDFPEMTMNGEAEGARAKAAYSPRRANGQTNTRPQERMKKSSNRDH
ncbi:small, acid-soluble spore protein K [Aquibacillus sp. 3ASR75-11]|uniref:Small, acid-soluble spore protein K n=1 Tax=Terrihalobacillus insolitus TaxID=2950438 RepID=A0A9X3WXP2_9BACI|nr:small acid-soluble spore protein K [Terrihalobacillus insolitus]MDC3413428.1 small, acid-soluble spore protein K [Terrihalobacillus insolitus]MDC3425279.1 small, acid-soluble spore protein K [Terrihalobacillus insolitus]